MYNKRLKKLNNIYYKLMISKYMMAFSQISQLGYWNKILH